MLISTILPVATGGEYENCKRKKPVICLIKIIIPALPVKRHPIKAIFRSFATLPYFWQL